MSYDKLLEVLFQRVEIERRQRAEIAEETNEYVNVVATTIEKIGADSIDIREERVDARRETRVDEFALQLARLD